MVKRWGCLALLLLLSTGVLSFRPCGPRSLRSVPFRNGMALRSRAQAPEKTDNEAPVAQGAITSVTASGSGKSRKKTPAVRAEDPVTIVVRRMSLRDVAAVFHIGEDTFTSEKFPQLYRTWSAYEVTDTMATDPELCFVAEEIKEPAVRRGRKPKVPRQTETRLVGFILATIQEKRKPELSCGYLGWVAVEAGHQRQGIGTLLVRKIETLILEDGIRTIVADTPQQNVPARNFLEKLGFGNPVSHVYMSFNMAKAEEARKLVKKSSGHKEGEHKVVKVRQMNIDDLASVHELGEQVFTADKYPNLYQMWSEAEVVEMFGSDSENCFVAEVEGTFVGFLLGTTIEKRHSSWKYGYLLWLGVSPQAQRLGVGKKLFSEFKDTMVENGCRLLLCDTQADNMPARNFFERTGFSNIENHVYYSKPLTPEGLEGPNDVAVEGEETEGTGPGDGAREKPTRAEEGVRQGKAEGKGQTLPPPKLLRLSKAKGKMAGP